MGRIKVSMTVDIEVDEAVLQAKAMGGPTGGNADPSDVVSATSDPFNSALIYETIILRNEILDHLPGAAVEVCNVGTERLS